MSKEKGVNVLARINKLSLYVGAWVNLVNSLIVIVSFGQYDPYLGMRYARWRMDARANGRSE